MNQNILHDDNYEEDLKEYDNWMTVEFDSLSKNEKFGRTVIATFVSQLNPTLEEVADIKTAVSEAVTNCIIHAYPKKPGKVILSCRLKDMTAEIEVTDYGVGIADVERAREPLYTSCPEQERSGMGFAFMETFMDEVIVESAVNKGTTIIMRKRIKTT